MATRKRYKKADRVDYRQGGRVQFRHGGGGHQQNGGGNGGNGGNGNGNGNGGGGGQGVLGETRIINGVTYIYTDVGWVVSPNQPNPKGVNPIDTSIDVPYGQTTETQSELARKQIADAAAGTGLKGEAKIKDPTALDTTKMEFEKADIAKLIPDMPEGFGDQPITDKQKLYVLRARPQKGMKFAFNADGKVISVPKDAGTSAEAAKVAAPYIETVTEGDDPADADVQDDVDVVKHDVIEKLGTLPAGYSYTAPTDKAYPMVMPPDGQRWAYGPEGDRITVPVGTKEIGVKKAEGEVSEEAKAVVTRISELTAEAEAAGMPPEEAIIQAKAVFVAGVLTDAATADPQTGIGGEMSPTTAAENSERELMTGSVADGTTHQIYGIPTLVAAERDFVKGNDRVRAGIAMAEETANLRPDITAAIIEDPVAVEAKLDEEDVEVIGAIAALPEEALVSFQMEGLLAGIEEGTIPVWARPAVAIINDNLADRGLDVSTAARSSLFNAIIQTTFPIAQDNARALQARAAQNLTNQQQAVLEESRGDIQRRMTNVANRQTAESQSAQMANNIAVEQGQLEQQAIIKGKEIQAQTYTQNLANRQEAARVTAQQAQQAQMASLSNEQQMEVANLQVEADRLKDEFSARQQVKLAKFQTAADFMAKNVAFANDMEKANLGKDVQVELANLTSKNINQSELMSNDEKIELANLESRMRVGLTNASLANAMGIAQLSTDQSIAINNAQTVAGMDMANFSMREQIKLANSKFMQSITMQDFSQRQQEAMQNATAFASLDLAAVDQRTKLAITNAQSFLQMDMQNLSNEQQAYVVSSQMRQQALLSDQAAFNASQQFNAASENQLNQYMTGLAQQIEITNAQRNDAMQQFNATQLNAAEARKAGFTAQANVLDAQLSTDVSKFNDQQEYNREQFNAANSNAIEQFNINWRRDANKIDTAATNAVNQLNAQNAFGLSAQSMSFMWQELRDQMDYSFKTYDNDQGRKASLIVAALGNESAIGEDGGWAKTYSGMGSLITNFLAGG